MRLNLDRCAVREPSDGIVPRQMKIHRTQWGGRPIEYDWRVGEMHRAVDDGRNRGEGVARDEIVHPADVRDGKVRRVVHR